MEPKQAQDFIQKEFPPLDDVAGRKYLKTEDGYHFYSKRVTKGGGELSIDAEMRIPASIERAVEDKIDFWNALQRRLLDDQANYLRQTELVTEEEKAEQATKAKAQLERLLGSLSKEDREALKNKLS